MIELGDAALHVLKLGLVNFTRKYTTFHAIIAESTSSNVDWFNTEARAEIGDSLLEAARRAQRQVARVADKVVSIQQTRKCGVATCIDPTVSAARQFESGCARLPLRASKYKWTTFATEVGAAVGKSNPGFVVQTLNGISPTAVVASAKSTIVIVRIIMVC